MYYRISITIFIILLLHPPLCAQNYELDKEIGAENAKLIEAQMGVYQNEKMSRYVEDIGNRLVAELGNQPFDYSFKIIDSEIPNAFALPGGYTFVTRGLLALINNEDELAGVMAHEIIHAHERHGIKQMRRGLLPALLKIPGAVVGLASEKVGNILIAPVDAVSNIFDANYSRKHEREADKEGIVLMASAGYDPQGLIECLSALSRQVEFLTGEEERASILNDHPITPKRVKYLNKEIPNLRLDIRDPETGSVNQIFDGMLFGPNPAQGIFQENIFLHPEMDLYINFPKGWTTVNTAIEVGAIQENQEAAMKLSLSDPEKSPKELAGEFRKKLRPEYRSIITREEPVKINEFDGYLIFLEEKSDSISAFIQLIWLKSGERAFLLSGFGLDNFRDILTSASFSLRDISESERKSINRQEILVVKAQEGETLSLLGSRTGNVIEPTLTAILNGLKKNQKLKKDQEIKIIIEKPY